MLSGLACPLSADCGKAASATIKIRIYWDSYCVTEGFYCKPPGERSPLPWVCKTRNATVLFKSNVIV